MSKVRESAHVQDRVVEHFAQAIEAERRLQENLLSFEIIQGVFSGGGQYGVVKMSGAIFRVTKLLAMCPTEAAARAALRLLSGECEQALLEERERP